MGRRPHLQKVVIGCWTLGLLLYCAFSLSPHEIAMRSDFPPFSSWGSRGPKTWNDSPKIAKRSGGAQIPFQQPAPHISARQSHSPRPFVCTHTHTHTHTQPTGSLSLGTPNSGRLPVLVSLEHGLHCRIWGKATYSDSRFAHLENGNDNIYIAG